MALDEVPEECLFQEGYSLIHPSKIVFRILTGQSVIIYMGPEQ